MLRVASLLLLLLLLLLFDRVLVVLVAVVLVADSAVSTYFDFVSENILVSL